MDPTINGKYLVAGRPAVVVGYSSTTVYYQVEHEGGENTQHRTTRKVFANPALVRPRS